MKFKTYSTMVTKLRLLLRLSKERVSQREMARQLELSRSSVRSYLSRFNSSGKTLEELEKLDDSSLMQLSLGTIYRQEPDKRYQELLPLLPQYSTEVRRKYVTVQLLWEGYVKKFQGDAYSYTTFKHHLNQYIKAHTYAYHNSHLPGEVLQVDFAGDALYITDRHSGDKSAVTVLCCTLPCSNYSFIYAMIDSSTDNLFAGLALCLEYIGGVPINILSDNMKQWVKKRENNAPHFTDAALEFGLHYSTAIQATGVRKPKHKASVEGSVHIIYQRIYAVIRDEVFYSIEELNCRLLELLDDYNNRKMSNREYSRAQYFDLNERETLQPLPERQFTIKHSKICKVASNYHIYVTTHQYSVPYDYVNQMVSVVFDKDTVEVYSSDYTRIAIHKRSFKKYGYTTIKDHMPPNHQAYESMKGRKDSEYYLDKAKELDESVLGVVTQIIQRASSAEQAYVSCEAIFQLHRLSPDEFVLACRYAQRHLSIVSYQIIKEIINSKVYLNSVKNGNKDEQIKHENLRGKNAYLS